MIEKTKESKEIIIDDPSKALKVMTAFLKKGLVSGIYDFVEVELILRSIRFFDQNFAIPFDSSEEEQIEETEQNNEQQ